MPTYNYREYGRYTVFATIEADSYEEAEEIAERMDINWDDVDYEPTDWEVYELPEPKVGKVIR